MSRKNDNKEEVNMNRVLDGEEEKGSKSGELFKKEDDDLEKKMNTVNEQNTVEKEREEEDEVGNEEIRQLLVAENAQVVDGDGGGVQLISATCQSPISKEKEMMMVVVQGEIALEKGEANGAFDANGRFYFYEYSTKERKSSVLNALLTLTLVVFNLFWSVGLTYWHFHLNNFDVAVVSLVIIALSGSITSIAFFTGRSSKRNKSSPNTTTTGGSARREVWRSCKLAWLLAAIPCLVPVILAGAYFISCLLDKGAPWSSSNSTRGSSDTASAGNEERQCAKSYATTTAATTPPSPTTTVSSSSRWLAASGSFFLLESLTLCFPVCVLHLAVLMENPNSIPSVIGCYTLLGLFILSFSITFSRFQFDCLTKPDRFGEKTEMYLRFAYLWAAKIIWLVTFAILIVTVRLLYPGREMEATVGAVAGLTAIHEIPLWICLIPFCGKLAAKLSGLFFLIPQFTSLISLIFWVNADPLIYHTNIGSIVLGLYFWAEVIMLCGWLADGNADKDVDLVPLYPHFFGDLISSFVPDENLSSIP